MYSVKILVYYKKGKVFCDNTMKAYRVSRGIAPLILNLGTDRGESSTLCPGRFNSGKKLQ
jgi:hypothetical protein